MRLIRISDLLAQPWKNGGGVTREIALRGDELGLMWRLSLADVDSDGAFSIFPGLQRILSVVDGAGLRLRHAGGVIEARPGIPVRFDGDIAIECELIAGPVRDFNIIFDPRRAQISVDRLGGGRHRAAGALGLLPLGTACEVSGFGAVAAGSFLLFGEGEFLDISIGVDGAALLTRME